MSQCTPPVPTLGTAFVTTLRLLCRDATRQSRVAERLLQLTLALVLVSGRRMVSRLLVWLGRGDDDWSAAYRLFTRGRVDLEVVRRAVVVRWIALHRPGTPLLTVLDGTQLPRTGRHMPGAGWLRAPRSPAWRPGIHRAQRWEGLSGLTPLGPDGDSRAIPLWFEPAPSPSAQPWPGVPPRTEVVAGLAALAWLRGVLDALGLAARPLVVLADGAYSGQAMWRALPARVTLVARCARNRAVFALPTPRADGRGRPRRYGARGPTPHQTLHQRSGWHVVTLRVRGRERHLRVRMSGPWLVKPVPDRPLFLLTVAGSRRHSRRYTREPLYLLVSARRTATGRWVLPFSVRELVRWSWQRWEVEVMHRELKSGYGLGDQQQWSATGAATVVPWVVGTYAVLVLSAVESWGTAPRGRHTAWYRSRRWTPRDALTAVRDELWGAMPAPYQGTWPGTGGIPGEIPRDPPRRAWLDTAHAL